MVIKEQELLQIDEPFIRKLLEKNPDALAGLSINLANDLKEAMERLNQNPSHCSKPSGSLAPWGKGSRVNEEDDEGLEIEEKEALRSGTGKERSSDGIPDVLISMVNFPVSAKSFQLCDFQFHYISAT